MWNKSISLPRKIIEFQDDDGFKKEQVEFEGNIPASFTDATRNDEILASQKGYNVDQNVEIMSCNYRGEEYLIDDETGEIYKIRRTFQTDKSSNIVLTCERR